MCKKELTIGILGVWLIILSFLGFPSSIHRILMIITGITIAFVSFWKGISEVIERSVGEAEKDEKIS